MTPESPRQTSGDESEIPASAHGAPRFSFRAFAMELAIYAVLVVGYFFFVLHFLGDWLAGLFRDHRTAYAFVAISLIVAQGVVLESLTSGLLRFLRARLDK